MVCRMMSAVTVMEWFESNIVYRQILATFLDTEYKVINISKSAINEFDQIFAKM